MMKNIIIIGSGAVASEITSYLDDINDVQIKGYLEYSYNLEKYYNVYNYKSPVIGSGFASYNNTIVKRKSSDTGNIEPGSSWLFLLSSTGLVGFISFLLIIFRPILFIIKKQNFKSTKISLIVSITILFFVHMFAEGYILSSGSFLFLLLWLCIGIIQPKSLVSINQ